LLCNNDDDDEEDDDDDDNDDDDDDNNNNSNNNKGTTKDSHIGHCTHATESANVKVQNVFHGRNNITCDINCQYRTAATLYTLGKCYVSCV